VCEAQSMLLVELVPEVVNMFGYFRCFKMQKRLDKFVQLAHRCDSSLATSSYSGLGQLRKAKRRKTAKQGALHTIHI